MTYALDMTKAHRQSFIELVNTDNAATIGTSLSLADVLIRDERALTTEEAAEKSREFGVTLENAVYAPDTVEVFFNKVALEDVMEMTIDDGDFDWYDADAWDDATSPAQALAAFAAAATRQGIDSTAAMESMAVTRYLDNTTNHQRLKFTLTSMVFQATAEFELPKQFSDVVTVTQLNGFDYSAIAAEDVVY